MSEHDGTETALAVMVPDEQPLVPLSLAGAPEQVLAEAHRAAKALKEVVESNPRALKFQGQTYLTFEDLQLLGRFYGVTARVVSTEPVEYAAANGRSITGWQAAAEAVLSDGRVIGRAEAMCLSDERTWMNKPAFQLRSMAQTRSCAKVLRSVLSWVVRLAGYAPTPAEEMDGVPNFPPRTAAADLLSRPAQASPAGSAPPVGGAEPSPILGGAQIGAAEARCIQAAQRGMTALNKELASLTADESKALMRNVAVWKGTALAADRERAQPQREVGEDG